MKIFQTFQSEYVHNLRYLITCELNSNLVCSLTGRKYVKETKTMKKITVSDTLIHHFNFIKMKYDVQDYSTAVMDSFPRPQLSHLGKNISNFFLVI